MNAIWPFPVALLCLPASSALAASTYEHPAKLEYAAARVADCKHEAHRTPRTSETKSSSWVAADARTTACFFGVINKESSAALRDIFASKEITALVANSPGGDVVEAISIADILERSHIDLVVDTRCMSSCANYWFVAASQKYVVPGALVAWHGIPGDNRFGALAAHQTFVERMQIRDSFMYRPDAEVRTNPEFIRLRDSDAHPLWIYPPAALTDRFGVKGIAYMWYPKDLEAVRSATRSKNVFPHADPLHDP